METADYFNKPELEEKATKPNKEEENYKSIWGGHKGKRALNKTTCFLDRGWEWAEEQAIPNNKTKGAEATKPLQTTCERTPDLAAVGAESKLSTQASRATLLWETLQGAEAAAHVPSVASVDRQHHPCSGLVTPKVEHNYSPGFAHSFLLSLGGDHSDPHTERFAQATAGDGESGAVLGPGD